MKTDICIFRKTGKADYGRHSHIKGSQYQHPSFINTDTSEFGILRMIAADPEKANRTGEIISQLNQ